MIDELIEKAKARMVAAIFAGHSYAQTGTNPSPTGNSSLTFADLEKSIQIIKGIQRKLVVVAFWCVDCREVYDQFCKMLPAADARVTPPICAIPIHLFQTQMFDPDLEVVVKPGEDRVKVKLANQSKIIWPWWCAIPGVWAEMGDGSVQRIILPSDSDSE